ncbi:hypothetical protein CLV80_106115 [Yoonia maritima]|uniref:Uncharacterized protein n=2 Tax=Yoonia maritima TaxID=1435347 RepID=A0A2T0VYD4_9RHOB|nr:hypothetical protein CLV80_106115 [Yoonia maritima]
MLLTTIFMSPLIFLLHFLHAYEAEGSDLVKFTFMFGAMFWWMWVFFLFFVPTGLQLMKRAKRSVYHGTELELGEIIRILWKGIANTLPFYGSGEKHND